MQSGNSTYILRGSKEFRQANLALFLAGFVTFSTLHNFQPLLPILTAEFGVTPATASLTLSVATLALAITLPLSGTLSEAIGRRGLMGAAVVLASLLAVATAMPVPMGTLIGLRLLQGLVLAGVPAVAMAYLSEEIDPKALGATMGLYIAGNACGGMSGRILTSWLADFLPWRQAIGILALASLGLSVAFLLLLPASRNFRRRPFRPGPLTASLLGHLREPGLLCLFAIAFTCMGGFVALYNYVTFRLVGAPYQLSHSQVALIFVAYAFGAGGSSMIGALVDRLGRGRVLFGAMAVMTGGVLLTLLQPLVAVVAGVIVFTIGFFGTHAVASAWVGSRAATARAQASSLYLFSYYLGASIGGTSGGFFWSSWGWPGVVLFILCLHGLAALAAMRLTALQATAERSFSSLPCPGEAAAD